MKTKYNINNVFKAVCLITVLLAIVLTLFCDINVSAAESYRQYKIFRNPADATYEWERISMKEDSDYYSKATGQFKAPPAPKGYDGATFKEWESLLNGKRIAAGGVIPESEFKQGRDSKFAALSAVWEDSNGKEFTVQSMDGFAKTLYDWAQTIYGDDFIDGVKNTLLFRKDGEDATQLSSSIWNTASGGYNVCISVGYVLIILFFLLELMDKTTHDNFNIEQFFRMFIKLIIAVLVMNNGLEIINYCLDFGNGIFEKISESVSSSSSDETIEELLSWHARLYDASTFTLLGCMVSLAFDYILIFIGQIGVWVCGLSRAMELGIRIIFTPLGIADMFGEGTRGPGLRYLKKFLAVCLQAAIMLVILLLYQAILKADMGTLGGTAIKIVSILTVLGLMFKSISFANDIVGV